jgi:hypothetical protein
MTEQIGRNPDEAGRIFRESSDDLVKEMVFNYFKDHPEKLFRKGNGTEEEVPERDLGKTPEQVARIFRDGSEDTLKDVVFNFFKDHPERLFRKRDVIKALTQEDKRYSAKSIKSLITTLFKEKQIDRERRKKPRGTSASYYGMKPAVERVRRLMNAKQEKLPPSAPVVQGRED